MWDLLRAYFGVALIGDEDTYRAFTTLTVDSVLSFVQLTLQEGRTEDIRRFEKYGEQIAREDLPSILTNARAVQQYLGYIDQDIINKKVSRSRMLTRFLLRWRALSSEQLAGIILERTCGHERDSTGFQPDL